MTKQALLKWEDEGGSMNEAEELLLAGTVNQIEWAKKIRGQVNMEFDRVRAALETVAARQTGQDRTDSQALIAVLEDKRDEVMTHREAGYFIHDWQELGAQVREMIMDDDRCKAIKRRSSKTALRPLVPKA